MSRKVGNDVVDLDDLAIAQTHLRARFVERVCADSERARFAVAPEPRTLLWSLFAAKEAAFKVVSKLGPRPVFAHRLFIVSPDSRSVRYGALRLPLWLERGDGWVHALVSTEDAKPLGGVELARSADLSAAAREFVLRALNLGGQVVRDPIAGSWDGYGPPRLTADPERDLSLSHDGRFVAYGAVDAGPGAGMFQEHGR